HQFARLLVNVFHSSAINSYVNFVFAANQYIRDVKVDTPITGYLKKGVSSGIVLKQAVNRTPYPNGTIFVFHNAADNIVLYLPRFEIALLVIVFEPEKAMIFGGYPK